MKDRGEERKVKGPKGLFQGEEHPEVEGTTGQTRRGNSPGHEWVQLAPNMGAGGSHFQATSDSEEEEEEDQQGCEESEQQEEQWEGEQAEEVASERVTVKKTESETDMEDESGTEEGAQIDREEV